MDYWNCYKDVWNFHKKYAAVNNTDNYWSGVIKDSDSIAKKYNNSVFVRNLLVAVITELEGLVKQNHAE